MAGITTILATAAATLGVVTAARHIRRKLSDAEKIIRDAQKRARSEVDAETLEFEKNPETGAYEAKDI